jgi:hypothetical protein
MVMKPYDPARNCPKCGSRDVSTSYEEGCSGWRGCTSHPEKLVRTCRNCHHSWDEAPLSVASVSQESDAK